MAQSNPSQNRPTSPELAPDPATNYERAKPEYEAGMGSLDSPVAGATPEDRREHGHHGVEDVAQDGSRQLNAHDDPGGTGGGGQPLNQPDLSKATPAKGLPEQPDHSMFDEEPDGWDQAPTDISDPTRQRHPRVGGKGGTPDAGENPRRG